MAMERFDQVFQKNVNPENQNDIILISDSDESETEDENGPILIESSSSDSSDSFDSEDNGNGQLRGFRLLNAAPGEGMEYRNEPFRHVPGMPPDRGAVRCVQIFDFLN